MSNLTDSNKTVAELSPEEEELGDQSFRLPVRQVVMVFVACATIDFIGLLDQSSMGVAVTAVGNDLHAGSQQSWIANGYFLTSASFQLLYGHVSDVWSRKPILFACLFLFFIGSLASSLAQTATQLIIFRAISGIGGGGIMTLVFIIVSDIVSLRERGKYQGIFGAAVAMANGCGPLIGGAFAHGSNWRWIFRLDMPLSVLCGLVCYFFLPLKPMEGDWKSKAKHVDWTGSVIILITAILFILGFTWAGVEHPWVSAPVLVPIFLALFGGVVFVLWEWKVPKVPLMPLRLYKSKIVCAAMVTMSFNGWCYLMQTYYLPSFYQVVYGYSPIKSATLLIPLSLLQTVGSTSAGFWISHSGRYREVLLIGWALWTAALGLIAALDENSSMARQIGYSVLAGFGMGLTLQTILIAAQGAVPRQDMAKVTSLRTFYQYLFGTMSLAVAGTIINNKLRTSLEGKGFDAALVKTILNSPISVRSTLSQDDVADVVAAYRSGFKIVFILAASLAGTAWLVTLLFMPQASLERPEDEALKQEAEKVLQQQDQARKAKAARTAADSNETV